MDDTTRNIHNDPTDDSDMKIVGDSAADTAAEPDDSESLLRYDYLRRSGELNRARRLGASAAGYIDEIDSLAAPPSGDERVALHRRLMIIFAAVVAIESGLPEPLLIQTALNAFYDTLKRDHYALYEAMSASGAITFYYLEYRRLGEQPADIGGAFAMLCGRSEDADLIKLGSDLFAYGCEYVGRAVDGSGFCG